MGALSVLALWAAAQAAAGEQAPASLEEEVWALAARVDKPAAYQTYLERFPDGPNRGAAVEAYYRLLGLPVVHAPPAPPQPPSPPAVPAPDPALASCVELLVDHETRGKKSAEAGLYIEARNANRPAGFQDFLARFPNGTCSIMMSRLLEARQKARRYTPIPGFGPLAPHRTRDLQLTSDDYPAAALRNEESGRVVAEWEVSEDGFVESCRAAESSGSAILDDRTCRVITLRIRYSPARDAVGAPTRATDRLTVSWRLPVDPPLVPPPGKEKGPTR